MLDSFFLVSAISNVINNISEKNKLKQAVKENGWDNPKWNKYLQEKIFDKYLWRIGECSEQEFMTTWELYQQAQKELQLKGFEWNPKWDRYTPKANEIEYVRGTKIYNSILNNQYHRYGESLEIQDKCFLNWLVGAEKIKANDENDERTGATQYELYLCCKIIVNSPDCFTPFQEDIMYSGNPTNEYGEPFHWYDDLMPFTPTNNYIPQPSKKDIENFKAKGINLGEVSKEMKHTVYNSYEQRKRALIQRNERMKNKIR